MGKEGSRKKATARTTVWSCQQLILCPMGKSIFQQLNLESNMEIRPHRCDLELYFASIE